MPGRVQLFNYLVDSELMQRIYYIVLQELQEERACDSFSSFDVHILLLLYNTLSHYVNAVVYNNNNIFVGIAV